MFKKIKLDLLTLLISLFGLISCRSDQTLTLPNSSLSLTGDALESFTLNIAYEKEDAFITSASSYYPCGEFTDPKFGKTTSKIIGQLSLPSAPLTFPSDAVLDSVLLVLRTNNTFYGDSTNSKFNIKVGMLDETMTSTTSIYYYSDKQWAVSSTVLGNSLWENNTVSEFALNQSTFNLSPTIKKINSGSAGYSEEQVLPQLRVKLDKDFFANNFLTCTSSVSGNYSHFDTDTDFKTWFKGLVISISKVSGNGGIIHFNMSSGGTSQLELYYHQTSNTSIPLVTVFPINYTSGRLAASIVYDYSGSEITDLQNWNVSQIYLQPMGGLRARIKFPDLVSILTSNTVKENISINRAELTFPVEDNSESSGGVSYASSPRLTAFQWTTAHNRKYIPDNAYGQGDYRYLGDDVFGGRLSTLTDTQNNTYKGYQISVTGFMQDLLMGKVVENLLFIAPSEWNTTYASLNTPLGTAHRVILSKVTRKPQLKIYYTKKNK